MARIPLPIQEAIRDLVGDLLGRGAAADKAGAPIPGEDVAAVASYRDRDGALRAAVVADAAAVRVLGAALVMVPEVVVQELERTGEIPENLYENYWEVANIMASLFNRGGGKVHVVLADRVEGTDVPDDVRALLDAPVRARWFTVTVESYGDGHLGFLAAD